jgi:hypothetical protein
MLIFKYDRRAVRPRDESAKLDAVTTTRATREPVKPWDRRYRPTAIVAFRDPAANFSPAFDFGCTGVASGNVLTRTATPQHGGGCLPTLKAGRLSAVGQHASNLAARTPLTVGAFHPVRGATRTVQTPKFSRRARNSLDVFEVDEPITRKH